MKSLSLETKPRSSALSASRRKTSKHEVVYYQPLGAAQAIFTDKSPELLISGPAGTGKSLACLYKLHALALKYPGIRGGIIRRTRTSLTQSALVTFDRKIRPDRWGVRFHHQDQEYRYPNGSVIVVGGLVPDVGKVLSAEYDIIYVQQAEELEESDAETLTTRLRHGVLPYQQLLMDCNPGAPNHWLRRRADEGRTRMLESRHEDNPTLWDTRTQAWTVAGAAYMAVLDALSGVRKLRLRDGIWAAAEGMVYEGWDRAVHLCDRFEPPGTWPRYWVLDFGYTNPFCWQEWVEDNDGRLYLRRELYHTQRLVEDWAHQVRGLIDQRPAVILCDHDAEDRATFERHLSCDCAGVAGPSLPMVTTPAYKAVSPGIQAVQARLRVAGDGRPRLFVMRDAALERDVALVEAHKPASTIEEIDGYIWDTRSGQRRGEAPVKEHDHGMDAMRYLVAYVDTIGEGSGTSEQYDRYGKRIG